MAEEFLVIDCDVCLDIAQYLNTHGEVLLQQLEGHMRTKGVTTTMYHLEKHLVAQGLAVISKKGTIRKKRYPKLTDRGKKALEKTLKQKRIKEVK